MELYKGYVFLGGQKEVKEWLADEESSCHSAFNPGAKPIQWHSEYVQTLQIYYSLRNQLLSGSTEYDVAQVIWFHEKLEEIEKKHSVYRRWTQVDREYKECLYALILGKKEQLLLEIIKIGRRRAFLLNLKKKYADGQKIANKLCAQILKETKSLKSLTQEYNACDSANNLETSDAITLSEALDPSSVETRLGEFGSGYKTIATGYKMMSTGRKRQILDAYLEVCRSIEEISMLKEEAKNLVVYYEERKKLLEVKIASLSDRIDSFSRGAVSLLNRLLSNNEMLLKQGYEVKDLLNNEKVDGNMSSYVEYDCDSDDSLDSDYDYSMSY